MKLKPYPEYKDSSRPWLGKIPVHWELVPAFAAFNECQEANKGLLESQVLSLSYGQIIKKREEALHGLVPASFETYQIVEPGNLILRLTDLQNDQRSLRVGLVKDRGIITSAYVCLSPHKTLLPTFAYYFLHAADVQKVFYSMGSGLRQSMGFVDLKHLPINIPSVEEQKQIINFLDTYGRKVHHFISAKRRLIKLLKEQKAAIINRSVTQGINPTTELKYSGIEWLGEIPAHWGIRRFKYCASIANGQVDPKDPKYLSMPLIAPNHMESGTGKLLFIESANEQGAESGKYPYNVGDILYSKIRPNLQKACIPQFAGLCSADMYPIRIRRYLRPEFLLYFLLSEAFTRFAIERSMRVAMPKINREDLNNCDLVLPALSEQDTIIRYIKGEFTKFDDAIAKAEGEIELIKEYHTRLIVDVVTGKLDVQNVEVSEIEESNKPSFLSDEVIDDGLEDGKNKELIEEDIDANN